MTHRHRRHQLRGPYGCAGQVAFVAVCRCGATRTTCSCDQCREQGTNDTGWCLPPNIKAVRNAYYEGWTTGIVMSELPEYENTTVEMAWRDSEAKKRLPSAE